MSENSGQEIDLLKALQNLYAGKGNDPTFFLGEMIIDGQSKKIDRLEAQLKLATEFIEWVSDKSVFIGFRAVTRDMAVSTLEQMRNII